MIEPFPAVYGSVEPLCGSPVRSKLLRAALVVPPISKQ